LLFSFLGLCDERIAIPLFAMQRSFRAASARHNIIVPLEKSNELSLAKKFLVTNVRAVDANGTQDSVASGDGTRKRPMAEVINLRRARRAKARADKEAVATQNRVRHGRPAHERKLFATLEETREHSLSLHLLADREGRK
jgi:hypothetical protein